MVCFEYSNVWKLMKKTQKLYRFTTLAFASLLLGTLLFTAAKPEIAYAVNNFSELSLRKKAEVWLMGRAVAKCIAIYGFENENKSESDMDNGKWLNDGNKINAGEWAADIVEGKSDDEETHCDQSAAKTLDLMGYSAKDALCKMNDLAGHTIWEREKGSDCASGTGDFDFNEHDDKNDEKDTWIWNRLFVDWMGVKNPEDALNEGMEYIIYTETFYQECSEDHGEGWGTPREWKSGDKEDKYTYKLNWNLNRDDGNNGGADKEWYVTSSSDDKEKWVGVGGYNLLLPKQDLDWAKCKDLASRINARADNYLADLKTAQDAGNTPNSTDSNTDGDSLSGDTDPTCESEGGAMAWIFCGLGRVIDGGIGLLDGWVNDLLFIDSTRYRDDNVADAWAVMRNIALLILVPMMMFMVIGTALNFGPFDPYTVKKSLPRMMVAVIFIVLSLPITQFGVQISNAFGQGLGNIIQNAAPTSATSMSEILNQNKTGATEAGFMGLVAVGVGVAVGSITIMVLLSFAVTTFAALLIGFVILVMRQVLVISLMVLAPLAILSWIFPGNDKLWGIWKGTFIAMLLMYPIIAILIASGRFVAGLFGTS